MQRCISLPRKRPSETGLSANELAQFVGLLPSRERAFNLIKEFIAEVRHADNPLVAFITAEWGEGKTSLYYMYLDSLKQSDVVSFIITSKTVLNYVNEALHGTLFSESKSEAYIALAAMLAALREEQTSAIEAKCGRHAELPSPNKFNSAKVYVQEALRTLLTEVCRESKVILFIDELEDIVSYGKQDVVNLLVSSITQILNGVVEEISKRGKSVGQYAGRLHFIFSITPSAYAKLRSLGDLATVIARFSRRIKMIELQPLPREEAYKFVKGLVSYLYDKVITLSEVFDPPTLVNPLVLSSLGNLAALQRAVIDMLFLNSVRFQCGSDSMKILRSENVIENLKDVKVHIAGADLPLLVESNYRKLCTLWLRYIEFEAGIDKHVAHRFLDYLLTNIIIEPTRAANDLGIERKMFESLVSAINVFVKSPQLGLNAKRFLYRVWTLRLTPELYTVLQDMLCKAFRTIPSLESESRELANRVIESLIYMDFDGSIVLAIPRSVSLAELKDFLYDVLPSVVSDVEIDKLTADIAQYIDEVVKSRINRDGIGERLLVSPKILSFVFLSPELTLLNFVKDIDRRFKYWRELLSEIPEEYLVLGFVAMLSSRDDKIKISNIEVL